MKYDGENDFFYISDGDPYVYTEQKRDYGRVISRANGARILDFGAHCGFFNLYACRSSTPSSLISVEPDSVVIPALRRNARKDTEIHQAAIVDSSFEGSVIPLYLGKTYRTTNSVEPYAGRQSVLVPVISFQSLLLTGVNFVKCDCEGGEYSLDWSNMPSSVHTIALEYHFARERWHEEMKKMDDCFLQQGFSHIKAPKINTFQKVSTGLYVRGE